MGFLKTFKGALPLFDERRQITAGSVSNTRCSSLTGKFI